MLGTGHPGGNARSTEQLRHEEGLKKQLQHRESVAERSYGQSGRQRNGQPTWRLDYQGSLEMSTTAPGYSVCEACWLSSTMGPKEFYHQLKEAMPEGTLIHGNGFRSGSSYVHLAHLAFPFRVITSSYGLLEAMTLFRPDGLIDTFEIDIIGVGGQLFPFAWDTLDDMCSSGSICRRKELNQGRGGFFGEVFDIPTLEGRVIEQSEVDSVATMIERCKPGRVARIQEEMRRLIE